MKHVDEVLMSHNMVGKNMVSSIKNHQRLRKQNKYYRETFDQIFGRIMDELEEYRRKAKK
ncbi:MAG: hypothetical protein M3P08_11080 [Thermoproteota archaeon]|nr:hypothetical protein [Thermoproteota archaeon]